MKIYLLPIVLIFIFLSVRAEIITDDTLNNRIDLLGPHFQIEAKLGQQHGGNLFHSFQEFNLQSHESATFSGPSSINNIINRITGGNPSNIDGLIRSTIPNADVYFLNPYGIFFGPNAKLDVQGSFHASTADYLRLQDGGRFEVRFPNESVLTVAPVEAFGFLTDSPAPVAIKSSKFSLSTGKTFSIIGGDIDIRGERLYYVDRQPVLDEVSVLVFPEGRLNFASIASQGEVILTSDDLLFSNNALKGRLEIENAFIDLTGEGNGSLYLRSNQFQLFNSWFSGFSLGNKIGGTFSITASDVEIISSGLGTITYGSERGGDVKTEADRISLRDGGGIVSGTYGAGRAGDIIVHTNILNLSGQFKERGSVSSIVSSSEIPEIWEVPPGYVLPEHFGSAGRVEIQASQMTLTDGASIASTTITSGNAGQILVKVADTLTLRGIAEVPLGYGAKEFENIPSFVPSSIISDSRNPGNGSGDAGHIQVEATKIILQDGGQISSSVYGSGIGHEITVEASSVFATGQGIARDGTVFRSGVTTTSHSEASYAGDAGTINVQASTVIFSEGSEISTSATNAGGGSITLKTPSILYLHNGQITTSALNGIRDGGNITIAKPQFIVLNQGQIKAQANEGNGGNIRIIAEQFIPSADSLISASSQKGISGEVTINSLENNISDNLVVLENQSLKADQIKTLCRKMQPGKRPSRFVITSLTAHPPAPDDDW